MVHIAPAAHMPLSKLSGHIPGIAEQARRRHRVGVEPVVHIAAVVGTLIVQVTVDGIPLRLDPRQHAHT